MQTPTFGEARFASTHSRTVSDEIRIPKRIEDGAELELQLKHCGKERPRCASP